MTTGYTRICDLPDLQVGDLLYVEKEGSETKTPLIILPSSGDEHLRAFFVGNEYDRDCLERGTRLGWRINPESPNSDAEKRVKVLRRLRGVPKSKVCRGEWDHTLRQLITAPAPETVKPLAVDDKVSSQAELDALPVGVVVQRSDGLWQRCGVERRSWRPVNIGGKVWGNVLLTPDCALPEGASTVVALDVTANDRVTFAREVAAQGCEYAQKALRENPPPIKVGEVVHADQWDSLPVGAVVPQDTDAEAEAFVLVKREKGWCCVWWGDSDTSRSVSSLAAEQEHRKGARLLALNCTATDRTELARQMAAAGIDSAAQWLKHHGLEESPVRVAEVVAPKIGDKVHAGESGRLPVGTVVELPGTGGYDYVTAPGLMRHVRMGAYELRENDAFPPPSRGCGGVIVALDVPATTDRRELARMLAQRGVASVQSACDKAGLNWRKTEPEVTSAPARKEPLKPGDRVDGRWDELPLGSVVDMKDGSDDSLAVQGTDRYRGKSLWSWNSGLKEHAGPGDWSGLWWNEANDYPNAVYVGQVPVGSTGETFKRALAECGYEPARLALEGAKKDSEKDLDGTTEAGHTEDMTITNEAQISIPRRAGESEPDFLARVKRLQAMMMQPDPGSPPLAGDPSKPLTFNSLQPTNETRPSTLMERFGASLKATGAGLASTAVDRAKVNAARVGLDAAKLGVGKAVVAVVEAVGGEKAAVSTLRVIQLPQVQVAADYLISFGADMAGRPALAAIARERAVERTVDGTFDFALSQVAKAGTQILGALTSADDAATSAIAGGQAAQVTDGGE